MEMGYATKVIDDEIQAYLQCDYNHKNFAKGVPLKDRTKYNKFYAIQN
jgi:hypothetical protein